MKPTPQQLADLAKLMGLAEVAIMGEQVFYLKPTYEHPHLFQPYHNAGQSQDIQQRLGILAAPGRVSGWVARIDNTEVESVERDDTLRGAILKVALLYVKFKRGQLS